MCIMSMVFDHYNPMPDDFWSRQKVDEFREAADMAKLLDKMMLKPDCEDPEKAKLVERVKELEAKLKAIELEQLAEAVLEAAIEWDKCSPDCVTDLRSAVMRYREALNA